MSMKLYVLLTCFFISIGLVSAQNRHIRGSVADEKGVPVIGASVVIRGTAVGTATDADGKFDLRIPQGANTLIISYLGMQTQEMKVKNDLRIILKTDERSLNEVVVTAQGLNRERRSIGYATQEIKANDLTSVRQTNLNNALAGKIAGARFVGGSGAKFDEGGIVLRGVTTITSTAGNNPLYVVDGIITSAAAVNMDDISSINVLKGPAATALYGVRGGNGAIIIVTKGFAAGENHQEVNISHTLAWETPYIHVKMQKEYGGGYYGGDASLSVYHWTEGDPVAYKQLDGKLYYDYADDSSWGPKFNSSIQYLPAIGWDTSSPLFGKTESWTSHLNLNDLFDTGVNNTTNVAFSRSGKGYSTRVSFSNVNITGVDPNSDAQRRYASIKNSFEAAKNLKISVDYLYTYKMNHNAAEEGYSTSNPYSDLIQWGNTNVNLNDYKDYRRPDGTIRTWNITSPTNMTAAFHDSPYAVYNENNRRRVRQYNVLGGDAEYSFPYNIKAGAKVSGNFYNYYADDKLPAMTSQLGDYQQWQETSYDVYLQGRITWDKRLVNDKLSINAAGFAEDRKYHDESNNVYTRDGLLIPGNYWNTANSVGLSGGGNTTTQQETQSVYGTLNTGWADTYYAEFSLRNDWNSTLPVNNNSYLYGGASVSAIASNWLKDLKWLSYWKLRASMAQVGSALNPYQLSNIYNFGTRYASVATLYPNPVMIDPNIKPTITTSYEVGTEFSFFDHRINADINLYNRDTKNQIINVTTSPESGYSSQLTNAGLIRNRGFEFTLGFTPVKSNDFQWDVNINLARNLNKLISLNGMKRYQLWGFAFYQYLYNYAQVGKPMGELVTSRSLATDSKGRLILKKLSGTQATTYGAYIPTIDTQTEKDYGSTQPDYTGGFNTTFRYKNLSLNAAFDFQIGGKLASITNMWGEGSGTFASTAGKNDKGGDIRGSVTNNGGVRIDGVVSDGNGNYTPVTTYVDANYYYQVLKSSTWGPYIYDATYLKMRELSLAYHVPQSFISRTRLGIKQATLSFVATNPWLIYSKIPNIDPSESNGTDGGYVYGGLESGQSVSTRSFGFTVNLTF